MDGSLDPEEACRLIGEELEIERSCVRPCFDENGSRVCCLVHENWVQRYIAGDTSHDGPPQVSLWSPYEHQLILQPSHPEPDAPWTRISIVIIKKPIRKSPLRKSFVGHFARGVGDGNKFVDLSYAELMQSVGVQNFLHSWDDALDTFPLAAHCGLPDPPAKESDKNMMEEILLSAYGLSPMKLDNARQSNFESSAERDAFDDFKEESEGSFMSLIMKQNVVPFVCALEGKSAYFLVEPYFQHSLHNMVTFSPSVLSASHMRPLFLIYQLLHALHWYHSRRLSHGALTLDSVKISKGLWIYLESPDFVRTLHHNSDLASCELESMLGNKAGLLSQLETNESVCKWTKEDLPKLVELWVHGKINNFDYLMALNTLVGRRLGDPNYHPVFPWVTDFSCRDGGYRDLKKSKFRLNKGDRQLDVTYKAALLDSQDGAPPHHVSDVLSDITYHVYLARRTPKSVLCDHVRTTWVANEYPSNMERLYHWTPDECIPQFFSDTSIFESIHSDLPDLGLPSWTPSAEEFIDWHRTVLESEEVSRNLHHWIDLTFGYKLAGKAAVKAKNVYLHLIDKHQSLSNHGVVQLFTEPHPGRVKALSCTNNLLRGRAGFDLTDERTFRTVLRLDSERTVESFCLDDSVHESGDFLIGNHLALAEGGVETNSKLVAGKETFSEDEGLKGVQYETISLPSDYNPLDSLQKFEALEKFKNQFGVRSVESLGNRERKVDEETHFGKLVREDVISLGCAIVEMVIPAKVQLSTCGLTGKQRERAIIKLWETNQKLLPRYARAGVQAFFKGTSLSVTSGAASHDAWLPPLTADLLLQPHLGLFPFPSYFSALHEFLATFYHSGRKEDSDSQKSQPPEILVLRNKLNYSVEQVDIATTFLPDLLPKVDDEGIKLLMYHLEPLFKCLETRLHACTQLFDMLAQALGPKNTLKTFLKCLVNLFDSHALENYEVIIRQTFLSQLIVRFGLDGFLKHFISFVVDAVAFKSKVSSVTDKGDRISVHSTEGTMQGISAAELEFTAKDVPLDIDDDLDLPGNFLREGSDVKLASFSMGIEELDNEIVADLGRDDRLKDDEISEQVTLMPREISEEDVDGRLFQGNISDDDDPVVDEEDGGRSAKLVSFHKIYEGIEIGGEASVVIPETEDSARGGNGAEGIVLKPQKGAVSERRQETEEAATVFEQRERDVGVTGLEACQGEINGHEADQKNAAMQKPNAPSRKTGLISDEERVTTEAEGFDTLDRESNFTISADFPAKTESGWKKTFDKNDNPLEDTEEETGELGEQEEIDDSLEEANRMSEDDVEEGEPLSEDEAPENGLLQADDDEAIKDEQLGKDNGKPVVPFYNGSKSKSMEREKKALKQRDELTPGTVSGIAAESIVWLAPRLGPVLTSKYIASQLLTMLPHCYLGKVVLEDEDDEEKMVNDRDAKWLLFCLANFCTLYGEAFMLNQYLPYIKKTIRGVQSKVTQRGEAALAGVLSLLKYCIPYLSRDTLSRYSEPDLMTGVFQPVIRILSSYNLTFPGGVAARQAICRSYIDVLTVVCLKLERELARENMTAPLQQFFSCFELERMRQLKENEKEENASPNEYVEVDIEDALERRDEDKSGIDEKDNFPENAEDLYNTPAYNELYETFNAAIAHHAFVPLCGIMGSKYMETALHNHDLIWNLCCSHDVQLSHPTCEDVRASEEEENGEETVDNIVGEGTLEVDSGVSGNRGVDGQADERVRGKKKFRKGPKPPMWRIGRKLSAKTKDVPAANISPSSSDQYLRGSWLTHWENQLNVKGKIGNKFNLQQVKLQTFTGHSGPVRSVYVQDSEHCFLSASKDKTVKLWSLSNHGDGTAQSASSWTYYRHTRPVLHVGMVESVRQAVSCDGSLHLWDPVSTRSLGTFDQPRNNPIVAMTALPAPSQCVVAAMAEGTARFLDVRQQSFVTEWKVTTSSIAGTVRDICCSPDGRWIALGFSSGLTSVLDTRGGLLRSHRRAHTSEIYQVKAFSNSSFVTSSVDSGLSLWKDDGLRLKTLKGPSDPLPSILVWRDQVISANMNGRIGVYNLQEDTSELPYFSYKLSSDVFRGSITCLGYLPLNRLLLIGSDTGNIVLCS